MVPVPKERRGCLIYDHHHEGELSGGRSAHDQFTGEDPLADGVVSAFNSAHHLLNRGIANLPRGLFERSNPHARQLRPLQFVEAQQADPTQFRNASFKGALHFWWRALNWGRALKQAGGEQGAALRYLHTLEGDLFGLASDGKNSKQSRVQIQTDLQGTTLKQPGMALQSVGYLLGQGLFRFGHGVLRQYLEGGELAVRFNFKPGTLEADIESVEQAAIALGLFGGLGSRARKGLGSLALQKIERPGQPIREFTSIESIAAFIQTLDFSAPADAPLSAFTQATRIDMSATAGKALV